MREGLFEVGSDGGATAVGVGVGRCSDRLCEQDFEDVVEGARGCDAIDDDDGSTTTHDRQMLQTRGADRPLFVGSGRHDGDEAVVVVDGSLHAVRIGSGGIGRAQAIAHGDEEFAGIFVAVGDEAPDECGAVVVVDEQFVAVAAPAIDDRIGAEAELAVAFEPVLQRERTKGARCQHGMAPPATWALSVAFGVGFVGGDEVVENQCREPDRAIAVGAALGGKQQLLSAFGQRAVGPRHPHVSA